MNRFRQLTVWLSRIGHCRGFGIQSPSDYWLVRYVINEHWPYYQYASLGSDDDWLRRKVGRLCLRLANWRQPAVVTADDYRDYLHAGCHRAAFGEDGQLTVLTLTGDGDDRRLTAVLDRADEQSVLLVVGLPDHLEAWRQLVGDSRAVITFDLYYCGLVLFDRKRTKTHYIINF